MKGFRYGVIGRGKWGARIHQILTEYPRPVFVWDLSRRAQGESREHYSLTVKKALQAYKDKVDIVWLAVPPGNQDIFVERVLEIGKPMIVEKPWMCDERATEALIKKSEQLGLQIGMDYQYCFLEKARKISKEFDDRNWSVKFSGEFSVSQKDRLEIPAIHNLGSHLLAIRNFLFPNAEIEGIIARYEHPDCRKITISSPSRTADIVFLENKEPLMQRLIESFEKCLQEKTKFPLDLRFALSVNRLIAGKGLGR